MTRPKPQQPTWPTKPLVDRYGGIRPLLAALGIPSKGIPDTISDTVADRWATRLGLHPDALWPGWSDAGLRYVDRVFIEEGGWRPAWLHTEQTAEPEQQEQAA